MSDDNRVFASLFRCQCDINVRASGRHISADIHDVLVELKGGTSARIEGAMLLEALARSELTIPTICWRVGGPSGSLLGIVTGVHNAQELLISSFDSELILKHG